MKTPAYHKSLETLHVNCLEPRAYFIPFADEKTAASRERSESHYFVPLCGEWDFRFFKSFEDVLREPPEYVGESGFDKISVPRSWQTYTDRGYDVPLYSNLEYPFPTDPPFVPDENPCGLYVRKFTLDEKLSSRDLFLNFEGVDSCFYVWLNGKFVGFSEVSHCTSEFDVTDFAVSGENTLCVLVVKWCPGTYLEDQDCFRFSGIFREVYLLARGKERLDDIFVKSYVSDDFNSAELRVEAKLSIPCEVKYKLVAPDGVTVSEGVGGEKFSISVDSPVLWNDEQPELYELWLTVGDEIVLLDTAVRRFEIKDGICLLNGKAVKARGINRHDSNPVTGHAVTLDDMIEDIMLIKRANCNMIRTSHYPNDPRFPALCDKYGIMLTDEADIETHGMGYDWEGEWDWTRWSHLSSAPEWRDAYVDRAKRLFERDKNHGCVVLWSLGNESGAGVNHRAMAQYIRSRDDRALVHYENSHLEFKAVPEGENFADISDVESRMYAGTEYIENYLNNKEYTKPFYMCEYVCSMSTGDVYPFWNLVEKYDNNFGGCIWEWCDHAVNVPDKNGNARYFYGGDFGDFPNSSICCIDGLVYPDRTPRPGYFDMKRVYQQYSAEYNCDGSVTVTSRRRFTTLDDTAIHWTLSENGKIVSEGTTAVLSTPAQGSTTVKLFDPADFDSLPSCLLTLSFVSTKDTPWAEKGFETGFEQFVLKDYTPYVPKDGRVELGENDRFAVIKAGNIAYTFDKPYGRISSIICGGKELLNAPVEPQIWRAPCYNRGSSEMWRLKNFRYAAQKTYSCLVCETDGGVCIKTKIAIGGPSCPPVIHADVDYKFTLDGCVTLCFDGDVIEKCPILPKVGYRLFMPAENENVSYFGFGPREAYVDRYKSQRLGLWNTTAMDNFEHYIRPQENGAHYGTRFAEVYSNAAGLRFEPLGMEHFSFNAQHFTAQMLEDTKHDFELKPLEDTVVSLDWRMTGISEAEYHNDPERALRRIDEKKLNFGFVIRPFEK